MKRIASLGLGKLAILATLASVLFVFVAFGQNMFSSGPLSEQHPRQSPRGGVHSHAEITSCSACHVAPWSSDTMSSRCLNCHDNIGAQLNDQKPLHGKLAGGQHCMSCHTEHKGSHGVLTNMARFDHECAAFPLTGKHQQADCASCHAGPVYQGAPQTCVSCHAEPPVHKGKFGTDCRHCHATDTWQATAFKTDLLAKSAFNHDLTGFKLTGAHAAVDCKSCHINNTFKGTPQACISCHAEPVVHRGKFGTDCATCHATTNWKSVTLTKETFTAARFDHDTTAFKLTGKHRMVDCKSCHTASTFKGTPQSCVACHAEPPSHKPHPKSFGVNCAQCHSTFDWKGAKLVKHAFPMNHRTKNRQNSACVVCHPTTINQNVTATGSSAPGRSYATYTCYGCHQHTPEKEAKRHAQRKVANLNDCAYCHPTGHGTKKRTALDGGTDLEFCRGCPEAAEDGHALNRFISIACPSAGADDGCTKDSKNATRLLLSLAQIPNVAKTASVSPCAAPDHARSTTLPALRVLDLHGPILRIWSTQPVLTSRWAGSPILSSATLSN